MTHTSNLLDILQGEDSCFLSLISDHQIMLLSKVINSLGVTRWGGIVAFRFRMVAAEQEQYGCLTLGREGRPPASSSVQGGNNSSHPRGLLSESLRRNVKGKGMSRPELKMEECNPAPRFLSRTTQPCSQQRGQRRAGFRGRTRGEPSQHRCQARAR